MRNISLAEHIFWAYTAASVGQRMRSAVPELFDARQLRFGLMREKQGEAAGT
jgi:hypothetical protein